MSEVTMIDERPPLQNRVTPFNELVADRSYRGMFMGNRGVLHDGHRPIVPQIHPSLAAPAIAPAGTSRNDEGATP